MDGQKMRKLARMRERGLVAANWIQAMAPRNAIQDLIGYIVELEAQLSAHDTEFLEMVMAPDKLNPPAIAIHRERAMIGGQMRQGLRIEISDETLDLKEVLVTLLQQIELANELRRPESNANAKGPDASDTPKDEGDEDGDGEPDGEPVVAKGAGKPTLH
jgi:hypothetical protein